MYILSDDIQNIMILFNNINKYYSQPPLVKLASPKNISSDFCMMNIYNKIISNQLGSFLFYSASICFHC